MTDVSNDSSFSAVRAICIGAMLLVVGSFWVVVQEILLNAGSLSANAPPVGAVGLFLGVLMIAIVLGTLRRRWGLGRKELLIIYCMLVTFFPLASQGLWHRFVGAMISVRTLTYYNMPLPPHMVPQGPDNLLLNSEFEDGLHHWEGDATLTQVQDAGLPVPAALLVNEGKDEISELVQRIARKDGNGKDRFGPGQALVFTARVRPIDFITGTMFQAAVSADGHRWEETWFSFPGWQQIWVLGNETIDGTGIESMISPEVTLPYGMGDHVWLRLRLVGQGRLAFVSLRGYSNEGIHRLMEGSDEIAEQHIDRVARDEQSRLFARPAGGWASFRHRMVGYIPWRMWLRPLAAWGLLWVAMFLAMYAAAAILFRQWSDHEKLTFPLTVLPLALTEPKENAAGWLPAIFTRRALWLGVATALVIFICNGVHFYNADFPGLPTVVDLAPLLSKPPWSAMLADGNGLTLRIVLLGVGVAFFMDLNMLFNLWFFFLLCKLLMLVPHYQGKLGGTWDSGPSYGQAMWHFQGFGSAIGIVLIALWLGRKHLLLVLRSVFRRSAEVNDADEPMPYRWAVLLLVFSFCLLGWWGHIAGAGWWFGIWSMGMMLILAVMASRVRAECAAPGMWIVPAAPAIMLMGLGGILRFGVLEMSYVILAGSFMCVGYFLMMMPAFMETFQIAKVTSIGRRTVAAAMVVGFIVAVASGGYMLLNWGYARGLTTMRGSLQEEVGWSSVAGSYTGESVMWRWRTENHVARQTLIDKENLRAKVDAGEQLTPEEQKKLATTEGSHIRKSSEIALLSLLATCALGIVRLTFLRFPFHPLGYAMATTQVMNYFWFSIVLAWLIRLTALRLGGVRMLRSHVQPYMIGLIVGSVLALLLWDVVAVVKIAQGYTGKVYVTW